MSDQVVTIPLDKALPALHSPDGVHRLAMSFLPDLHGASRAIRADMGVLFRMALPTEVGGTSGAVTLRFRADLTIPGATVVESSQTLLPGQRITVRVVSEKRREDDDGRMHSRPVLDEEADQWATELLQRHGIEVSDVVVSPSWRVGKRGERSFSIRDITATVASVAPDCQALTRGIGRGKAFGYGMPLVL